MNSISIAGQTDVGQRRKDNQDTLICSPIWSETSVLLGVIDGVGGYAGGDKAAAIAKESIEQYMAKPNGDPLSMLREAVVFANNQINAQRQENPQLAQMACVLTTAVADSRLQKVVFVHVGDTRLYRLRQGVLEKLTHDHSLVGVREDANELTEAEAMKHPRRNEILRDLGSLKHRVDDPDFLESGEASFEPGDQLLLCSDGLTDMITQAQVTAILTGNGSLNDRSAELIRLANSQGGNDNITVVLAANNTPPSQPAPSANPPIKAQLPQNPLLPAGTDNGQPVRPQPEKSRSGRLWVVATLLLVGGITGLVWYNNQPSGTHEVIRTDSLTTAGVPGIVLKQTARLDSLMQVAYRSADHQLNLPADTVWLDRPLLVTDSLQRIVGHSRLTVLLPADTAQAELALQILRSGPVHLENMVICGFRTGIETIPAPPIQLSNVYFRGVGRPIQAVIRQDTFRNAQVQVSIQNRSVSTQPHRP
ncbi:protein phosphatase 2C domain-containing protein [Spirosoma sp. SC4-14]|uniref:PP2C family protein-serine/threonine phosphatase n=1 Tax=Spirosoma sp. SC4-14 TaxID=3128900 RepID=UPI0030D23F25